MNVEWRDHLLVFLNYYRLPLSFQDYLLLVQSMYRVMGKKWRRGQIHFNVLSEVRPDLAERLRGELEDPFYRSDEEGLADYFEWLDKNWESSNGVSSHS